MRKLFIGLCFSVAVAFIAHSAPPRAAQANQRPAVPSSTPEDILKRFLQGYVGKDGEKATRYFHAFVDLDGDGKNEVIVYLAGRQFCGSGGCPTLVLASELSSYRVVTEITITRLPIRVLRTSSNGWRNIAVLVSGGGVQPGYEAELRFNGSTYPSNPSVPPARRLAAKIRGEVVIPSRAAGTALYP